MRTNCEPSVSLGEGHRRLAGRRIVGGMRRKAQWRKRGNGCMSQAKRKPVFLPETDGLVDIWTKKVSQFLMSYEDVRVSSRKLKILTQAERLTKITWSRVIQRVVSEPPHSSKKDHVRGEDVRWTLVGQSLVRESAESFCFKAA